MNKHIFRLLAASAILMFPCFGTADDGTVASNAVSMGAEFAVENGKEIDDGTTLTIKPEDDIKFIDNEKNGVTSGSDTLKVKSKTISLSYTMDGDTDKHDWHYLDPPDWVAGNIRCTLYLYDGDSRSLIKKHSFTQHEYDSLNYDKSNSTINIRVSYAFETEPNEGFYKVVTEVTNLSTGVTYSDDPYSPNYPAKEASRVGTPKVYYFKPDVTNLVANNGTIMSSYKFNSYVNLCWLPVLDWDNCKKKSTSYRVYIYDQQFKDGSKSHGKPYVYDEVIEGHCSVSIRGTLLPYGDYTIYVMPYAGGTELKDDLIQCVLKVKDQSYTYDWDVGKYVTPEPGEHATRQHAEGDKDMTSYTETLDANDLGGSMTKLTSGILTLDVDCSGASFTASVNGDTITLNGSDDKWRFTQQALEVLDASGIKQISLSMKNGIAITIPTSIEFTGYQYTKLRAQGLVSKDFRLVCNSGRFTVEVGDEIYDLNGDGTLSKQTEEETAQ